MARRNREEEVDDAASAADERALKELEKPEKPSPRVSQAADEPDEFEVDDEPEDDDEPEPQQRSRTEKRRDRGQNREKEWQEREQRLLNDAAEQRALYAALINQASQRQQAPAPQNQVDPEEARLEQEIKDLEKQRRGLIDRHQALQRDGKLDAATHEAMQDDDFKLRQRIARSQHQLFAPRQQQGPTAQQLQAFNVQQRLAMDHGDIWNDPVHKSQFTAEYNKLRFKQQKPESWETMELAAAKAREALGLPPKGGRPAPSAGTRAKFSGAPRGGGAGGSNASGGGTTLKMTKELKDLADAAYPKVPESKRYQYYANRHGKALAKYQGS